MLQVTSRRKGNGNELNCSRDELQWGSVNDLTWSLKLPSGEK